MAAIHVTADNFEAEVLKAEGTVLVDFWADWCGPCRMLSPIIEQVAEERSDIKVCKINVDESGSLAEQYKVSNIPTLTVFKNGVPDKKSVGVISKSEILSLLD